MNSLTTIEALFNEAQTLNLYKNLVLQLNKDLRSATIDLDFDEDVLPTSLRLLLFEEVYRLIQEKFTEYLNLLYIIDVPEKAILSFDEGDTFALAEHVTFLILKREWQKVWYRANY